MWPSPRNIFVSIIASMLTISGVAQTRIIDSLKSQLNSQQTVTGKLDIYLSLCRQHRSLPADTIINFANIIAQSAKKNKDAVTLSWAECYAGIAFVKKGLYDTAIVLATNNLRVLENNNTEVPLQIELIFVKAAAYIRSSHYKEALAQFLEALHKAEENNNKLAEVRAKSGAGWVNMELSNYKEALDWFIKSINTTTDSVITDMFPTVYSNISSTYDNLGKFDSALYYAKKAIATSAKIEELSTLANALNIEADIYINTKESQLAEMDLNRALEIRKLVGEPYYIVSDMAQLAGFYSQENQAIKGINIAREGIAIAQENGLLAKLPYLYEMLGANYKAAGDYKNYSLIQEKLINLKDSLYQKNSADALADIQAKYELQKKENTIIQQKLDLTIKNYWLYGSMIVLAFGILLFYLLFQNYQRKQHLKMEVAVAKEKIQAGVAIKEAEESERRRIAADLHDNLGTYAASIMANIDTLSKEGQFNLTAANAMKELSSNSLSIVSQLGDTIWALKRQSLSLTTVSDRIKLVIQKVGPSYPSINFDVVEKIEEDRLLPPVLAFHLFQTIQEALINALKHSGCSHLVITFFSAEKWMVLVQDNGKGIQVSTENNFSGNGISNMQSRAAEAGFLVEWLPNAPSGTTVQIQPTAN